MVAQPPTNVPHMSMVRIATFNVRRCLGIDSITDTERTAAAIQATGADIVALQELDRGMARSGDTDQPAAIARVTGMNVLFWPTLRRGGGEYGIAIAVRGDAELEFRPLPRVAREEPRGAIVGHVDSLGVVAAHAATHDPARRAHLDAVAALAAHLGAPAVVLGDLNATRSHLTRLLAEGFDAGPRVPTIGPRIPAIGRRRQIDYVMAGPGVRLLRSWTVPTDASDHLPLVAEVEIE